MDWLKDIDSSDKKSDKKSDRKSSDKKKSSKRKSGYNFQYSDMILSIGGKILLVILLLMLFLFGTAPLSFPANAVRKMFNSASNAINSANKGK